MIRSLLFVPADKPNLLIHSDDLGADAVIFDLEDAVAPSEKDSARILLRHRLKTLPLQNSAVVIRINSLDTAEWQKDLEELLPLKPQFIMPTKISDVQAVKTLDHFISRIETSRNLVQGAIGLIPLIETALGLEQAFHIASASPRVRAMLLGAEDLSADLQCLRTTKGDELFYARSRIVAAARAADIEAFDTPFTDVFDDEGASADAALARHLGFSGKSAISPRHVKTINRAFSPTEEEIQYARDVIAAIEAAEAAGLGVVSLRGKMIDAPIVTRARQILASASTRKGETRS